MKFKWETIDQYKWNDNEEDESEDKAGFYNQRVKVFGGWIMRILCWDQQYNLQSESSVFVPDPNHEWEV